MPKRILVADDSRTIRLAIAYTFQKEPGVELLLAPNGNATIDILRQESVDLLLLDYKMPDIDGSTLCTRLKQEPQLSHIPILLIVGKNFDHSKLSEMGADGVIQKPFLSSSLIKQTAEILHFSYEPAPLSIEEEIRGTANDSIEIDIDLNLDDLNAPLSPVLPPSLPPALPSSASPWENSSPPTDTPFLPPETPNMFAPPQSPRAPIQTPTGESVIDDLPYEEPAQFSSSPPPLLPPLPFHTAPPKKVIPASLTTARISEQPFMPNPNAGFPQEPLTKPSASPQSEDLEVFVGKPVEVTISPKSDISELLLPMEDEPLEQIPAPASLLPVPPLTGKKPEPLLPPHSPFLEDISSTAPVYSPLQEGNLLQPLTKQPEPPPLPSIPSFPPKKPPSSASPSTRQSPQATQKFQMVDLLKDKALATPSPANNNPGPSLVSVDDFLPDHNHPEEQIQKDILGVEVDEKTVESSPEDSVELLSPPNKDAFVNNFEQEAKQENAAPSNPFILKTESEAALGKGVALGQEMSSVILAAEKRVEAQVLAELNPQKDALAELNPQKKALAELNPQKEAKDTQFEVPFVEAEASEEASLVTIKVPTVQVPTVQVEEPNSGNEDNSPYLEPKNAFEKSVLEHQVEFMIGESLSLEEQTLLLQYLNYTSLRIEELVPSAPHKTIFAAWQRTKQKTALRLEGNDLQLRLLSISFLAFWHNVTESDLDAAEKILFDPLPDAKQPKMSRALIKIKVDTKPFIQAMRSSFQVFQTTELEEANSHLQSPSKTLFIKRENEEKNASESDQKERAELQKLLQEQISIHQLSRLLEEEFSISLSQIVPLGLPQSALYLAVIYHFELRYQIPDLAEIIQETFPSFETKAFFEYPGA